MNVTRRIAGGSPSTNVARRIAGGSPSTNVARRIAGGSPSTNVAVADDGFHERGSRSLKRKETLF
jgi:hypothetical protein